MTLELAGVRKMCPELPGAWEHRARIAVWGAVAEAMGLLHPGQVDAMVGAAPWIAAPAREDLSAAGDWDSFTAAAEKAASKLRDRALCPAAFWKLSRRAPGRDEKDVLDRLEGLRRAGLLGRVPENELAIWLQSDLLPVASLAHHAGGDVDPELGAANWAEMAGVASKLKPSLPFRAVIGVQSRCRAHPERIDEIWIEAAARVVNSYSPVVEGEYSPLVPYWTQQVEWQAMRRPEADIQPTRRVGELVKLFRGILERGKDPERLEAYIRHLRGSFGPLFRDDKDLNLVRDAFKERVNRKALIRSARKTGVTIEDVVRVAHSAGVLHEAIRDAEWIVRGMPPPRTVSIEEPIGGGDGERRKLEDMLTCPRRKPSAKEQAASFLLDLADGCADDPKLAIAVSNALSGRPPAGNGIGRKSAAVLSAAASYFQKRTPLAFTAADLMRRPGAREKAAYAILEAVAGSVQEAVR